MHPTAAAAAPLLVALSLLLAGALGSESSSWEWQSLSTMKTKTGDYITCRLTGFLFLNTHWLMATDEERVVMVWPEGEDHTVIEWPRADVIEDMTHGVDWEKCWNYGPGPAGGGPYVLERARRYLSKPVYYHLLTCNSEHYVKFWTEQNYNINQSGSRASSYCSFFHEERPKQNQILTSEEQQHIGLEFDSID